MVGKIRAALAARKSADTFVIARTDGRSAVNMAYAIDRGKVYRDAGADGVYVEGLRSAAELKRVGKTLATTLMRVGGQLSWLAPRKIYECESPMILYPTTVLFPVTRAAERALAALKAGKPMASGSAANLDRFEEIVGLSGWQRIEFGSA